MKKEVLPHTNRYLAAKHGGLLYKIKGGKHNFVPPMKGQYVTIVNDFEQGNEFNIDYRWYENQVKKLVNPFVFFKSQLTLFDE